LELEAPATAPGLEQTSQQASCPALLNGWSLEESPCLLKTKDTGFEKYHNFHMSNFSDIPEPLFYPFFFGITLFLNKNKMYTIHI